MMERAFPVECAVARGWLVGGPGGSDCCPNREGFLGRVLGGCVGVCPQEAHQAWAAGVGGRGRSTSPHALSCLPQEHPFFTLHKTKKTDIAAFVKKILGEDS